MIVIAQREFCFIYKQYYKAFVVSRALLYPLKYLSVIPPGEDLIW